MKEVEDTGNLTTRTHNSSFDSYAGLWDVIKFKIKDYAIRYGKTKKKRIAKVKNTANFMADDRLRNEFLKRSTNLIAY